MSEQAMSVLDFLRVSKKSPAASQIAEMEQSLERLRGELKSATEMAESHAPKRAEMLLSAATEEEILKLDKQADLARLRLERLELAEVELQDRIAAAKDSAAREGEATRRERAADDLEKRAAAIEKTIEALAESLESFIAATPADLIETAAYRELIDRGAVLTPQQAASAALASALFGRSPDLFDISGRGPDGLGLFFTASLPLRYMKPGSGICAELPRHDEPPILPFSRLADEVLVKPMRERARELRGSDDLELAAE